MYSLIKKHPFTWWVLSLYIFIFLWWLKINLVSHSQDTEEAYIYNFCYGFIPFTTALLGVYIARAWGGFHAYVGRGVLAISIGLFAQWLGLMTWTFYNVVAHVTAPYPSLADFGYLALVPAYTYAAYCFSRAVGGKYTVHTFDDFMYVTVLPFLLLFIAYLAFIQGTPIDGKQPLTLFLNLAYPLGEMLPLSIAVYILHLSNIKLRNAIMYKRMILLAVAFIAQFVAEYIFLYRNANNMLQNGGVSDLAYPTAYILMALTLVSFSTIEDLNKSSR